MGWFSKSVKGSDDERDILITAKDLLKKDASPRPSIRGAILQAAKNLGYGTSSEVAVTLALRRNGEIPADTVEGVEEWGIGTSPDDIQKAFATAIDGLKK